MRLLQYFALALCLITQAAYAQGYPERSINLVVPFPPGGSADAVARPIAEKLATLLGKPVVVENRGGANTTIGALNVAQAPADGYRLFLMPGTHVLNPRLMKSVPFDPIADFTPVSMIASSPYVLFAAKNLPFDTLQGMVNYARDNPGKVSVGTTDALGKMASARLARIAGVQLVEVSYKGAPQLTADVMGGHLAMGVNTPVVVRGLHDDGSVRALAVTGAQAVETLKGVPTAAQVLGEPNYDFYTWFALAGPAGLSPDVVSKLEQAMSQIVRDPDIRQRLVAFGMTPAEDTTPAYASKLMRGYMEEMGKLVEAAGITPQ
jgi:tripartite-type tricarboxylate transporter receptor subunit TctC